MSDRGSSDIDVTRTPLQHQGPLLGVSRPRSINSCRGDDSGYEPSTTTSEKGSDCSSELSMTLRSTCSHEKNGLCCVGPGIEFRTRLTPSTFTHRRNRKSGGKSSFYSSSSNYEDPDEFSDKDEFEDLSLLKGENYLDNAENFRQHEDFINTSESGKPNSHSTPRPSGDEASIRTYFSKLAVNSTPRFITKLYETYLKQSVQEKNATKTGYTYACTLSHNPLANRTNPYHWIVPNMSRKTNAALESARSLSVRENERVLIDDETMSSSSESSINMSMESSRQVTASVAGTASNASLVFTRSQCQGGKQCSAGCELHGGGRKRVRKAGRPTDEASVEGSEADGSIRREEFEFSDDDNFVHNRDVTPLPPPLRSAPRRQTRTAASSSHSRQSVVKTRKEMTTNGVSRARNHISPLDDEDVSEDEELTIVRKITRTVVRTVRNSTSAVQSNIPEPIQRIYSAVPPSVLIAFVVTVISILFFQNNGPQAVGTAYSTAIAGLSSLGSSAITMLPFANLRPSAVDYSRMLPLDAKMCGEVIENAVSHLNLEIQHLREELNHIKSESSEVRANASHDRLEHSSKYEDLQRQHKHLEDELSDLKTNCCHNESRIEGIVSKNMANFWSGVFSDITSSPSSPEFASQVRAALMGLVKQEAESLRGEIEQTKEEYDKSVEQKVQHVMGKIDEIVQDRIVERNLKVGTSGVTLEEVKDIIKNTISVYDADKTGLPDFALEPAGGSVVNIRCSETFDPSGVQYKIWGIPVWSTANSPRTVIQPTIAPGECWAYKGSQGRIVVKLSEKIVPTSFTYEHIPKQISRDGNIMSAPKQMQVRGLANDDDKVGDVLGNYEYLDNDQPLQNFPVQDLNPKAYQFIELIVQSNHGHPEYSCLYRFRVHGRRTY